MAHWDIKNKNLNLAKFSLLLLSRRTSFVFPSNLKRLERKTEETPHTMARIGNITANMHLPTKGKW